MHVAKLLLLVYSAVVAAKAEAEIEAAARRSLNVEAVADAADNAEVASDAGVTSPM